MVSGSISKLFLEVVHGFTAFFFVILMISRLGLIAIERLLIGNLHNF